MKIFPEALIFPDNDFLSFLRSLLLRKSLLRWGKLAKSEGFKAKAALLVLTGSISGAGGASSRGVLDWLVPCVVEFLTSEDWAIKASPAVGLTTVGHHLKRLLGINKIPSPAILSRTKRPNTYNQQKSIL
jgi:hypothetical protein